MTDTSARLGLVLPTQVDPFNTEDIYNNWNKIDGAPGSYICTSTTRPTTWGAGQAGRKIIETDTGLEWRWDGTAFKRMAGLGLLKKNDGTFAIGERTTNAGPTSSVTYTSMVAVTNVVVPDGNRPLEITASWLEAANTGSDTRWLYGIFQSNVSNSGPLLSHWYHYSGAGGGFHGAYIRNGLAAGTYNFSFQIHAVNAGQAITVYADATEPITITVIEL